MVKVMYNDILVYKVVIWVFFWISLWKEKEALNKCYFVLPTIMYLMNIGMESIIG